jgi:hypothetical protein
VTEGPTGPAGLPGPRVFITYRREETAAHAGRLYDAMVARFGEGNVFMDVDMAPGVDFVERITEAVAACHVLIVVMGPRWATVQDEQGRARLADPEDFVRLEVETALRRPDVTPIPVLVAGARMPNREDLPPELRAITRRNALELADQRWRYDVGRLISTLDELLAESPVAPSPPSPERSLATGKAAPADAARTAGETAPPSTVAGPTPAETKPAARAAGGGRRTRWALLGALAVAAIVVAVVVASDGGGGEGAAEEAADYQALLELIPADIRPSCKRNSQSAHWMVVPGEATAQTLCADPREYYLSYGLWRSPLEAQDWVVNSARDANTLDCEANTTDAMKRILPRATTGCEDIPEGEDKGIKMWWSEDASRAAAWFSWPDRGQEDALQQWERLVTND